MNHFHHIIISYCFLLFLKERNLDLRPGMFFHPLGLLSKPVKMVNRNETLVFHTFSNLVNMLDHQDKTIDYLKIDIEGYEWEASL